MSKKDVFVPVKPDTPPEGPKPVEPDKEYAPGPDKPVDKKTRKQQNIKRNEESADKLLEKCDFDDEEENLNEFEEKFGDELDTKYAKYKEINKEMKKIHTKQMRILKQRRIIRYAFPTLYIEYMKTIPENKPRTRRPENVKLETKPKDAKKEAEKQKAREDNIAKQHALADRLKQRKKLTFEDTKENLDKFQNAFAKQLQNLYTRGRDLIKQFNKARHKKMRIIKRRSIIKLAFPNLYAKYIEQKKEEKEEDDEEEEEEEEKEEGEEDGEEGEEEEEEEDDSEEEEEEVKKKKKKKKKKKTIVSASGTTEQRMTAKINLMSNMPSYLIPFKN